MTTLARSKIWHPAFDVYHCAFRLMRILLYRPERSMSVELLHLIDFYLLYPFLLHRASMPDQTRRYFRELEIKRDRDHFVQVPSEKSLYRDIALFQKTAVSGLVAKNIVERDPFLDGQAILRVDGVPERLRRELKLRNEEDLAFMEFLIDKFGSIPLEGPRGLRALTGLVRRQ